MLSAILQRVEKMNFSHFGIGLLTYQNVGKEKLCEYIMNAQYILNWTRDLIRGSFLLQKADGTCNTNFKTTKLKEQVMRALEDFVDGNTETLVGFQSRWFEIDFFSGNQKQFPGV